ncbi:MAG: flagellar biosynthesis protein FlhB [Acidobacteriota bacterium]
MSQTGERTEQATPRKLEKAREEGRIVSSRYLVVAVQFVVAFYGFKSLEGEAGLALEQWRLWLSSAFEAPRLGDALLSPALERARQTLSHLLWAAAATTGSGLAAQMVVSQGYFSLSRLKPDVGKIFSLNRLQTQWREGLKSLALAGLILFLFAVVLWMNGAELLAWCSFLARMPVLAQWLEQGRQLTGYGKLACLLFVIVGAVDLGLAMRKFREELKMTKQELKEEFKEGNGNPEVKAKIRKIMKEFASRRMMSQVPKATVVITNPTHYAVAIRYEAEEMTVPLVLAKGVDHTALRIRKIALEKEIPIIENPPLAQALYKSVEAGQEIPLHLYRAVAEVLAYVYRILGRSSAR